VLKQLTEVGGASRQPVAGAAHMQLPGARDAAWQGNVEWVSDDDDVDNELNQHFQMLGRMGTSPWELATGMGGVSGMGIDMGMPGHGPHVHGDLGGFAGLQMPVHFEHGVVHTIGDAFDSHSESD